MKLDVIELRLNGNLMPAPLIDGVDLTKDPIWSKNAGRNGATDMVGTILKEKRTTTIKWPPLLESQVNLIEANLSKPGRQWITIDMTMADRTIISYMAYSGPPKSKGWNALGGTWRRTGMQVSIIEK